jgi:hypothetical protein
MVRKELANEFWRTHNENNPRVKDFRAELAAAAAKL